MKPNFALDLSYSGIALLRRQADETWLRLGTVPLDSPDLPAALAELRAKATPGPLTSLLILPPEQVLFTTVDMVANASERETIANALDGRTPYDIEDLVFDWTTKGPTRQVAAVALETLAEAEGFATENGFNPVAFTVSSTPDTYDGFAHLGQCGGAEAYLDGATLHVETHPIVATDTAFAPPEPKPEPKPEAKPAPETDPAPILSEPTVPEAAEADTSKPDAPRAEAPESTSASADPKPSFSSRRPTADPQLADAKPEAGAQAAAERLGKIAPRIAPPLGSPAPKSSGNAGASPEAKPEPTLTAKPPVATPKPAPASDPAATPVPLASAKAEPAAEAKPAIEPVPVAVPPKTQDNSQDTSGDKSEPKPAGRSRLAGVFGLAARLKPTPKPAAPATTQAATQTADFSLPGLARQRQARTNKLGLWLTLVLLLMLIVIGVWSLFALPPGSVSRWFGADPPTATASLPAAPSDSATQLLPSSSDTPTDPTGEGFSAAALAPMPNELTDEPELDDAGVEAAALDTQDPFTTEAPVLPTALEIVETYTASGIWIGTPIAPQPVPEDQLEALYQTNLDPQIAHSDAVALPDPRAVDQLRLPRQYLPPPPAGTTYALDANGNIAPTPEGVITPDGVRVVLGRPEVDVFTRPRPTDGTVSAPETEEEEDPQRALLARIKPTPRPDDFAESIERAQNNGRTRAELARVRPTPRPESAQALALAAAKAAAAASLVTDTEDADAADADTPTQSTSPLAIASSAQPRSRPRNFDRIVARTREAQQNAPAATATAAAPRNQPARTLPSGATVARAATQENVLPMRNRVNLIGVFGKPSNPKALVRMRNGKTRRVGVGDRVDGGRVTSIGKGRLTYRKGSRDLALEMPRI